MCEFDRIWVGTFAQKMLRALSSSGYETYSFRTARGKNDHVRPCPFLIKSSVFTVYFSKSRQWRHVSRLISHLCNLIIRIGWHLDPDPEWGPPEVTMREWRGTAGKQGRHILVFMYLPWSCVHWLNTVQFCDHSLMYIPPITHPPTHTHIHTDPVLLQLLHLTTVIEIIIFRCLWQGFLWEFQ